MMVNPIQIVLEPENFETDRETPRGGSRKDFYANDDESFRDHKAAIKVQIESIRNELITQSDTAIGYLKVKLARRAWAKSHRPTGALFKSDQTPVVGGGDLGEIFVETSPRTLAQVARTVDSAEDQTRFRSDPRSGRRVPYPSRTRSEVGALESIRLFGPADRRGFTVEQAISWLETPTTGNSYEVEIFRYPPLRNTWDALDEGHRNLYSSFVEGLAELGPGLVVRRLPTRENTQPLLSARLEQSDEPANLLFDSPHTRDRRQQLGEFDAEPERHAKLLEFFSNHPLVSRINLPPIIVRSAEVAQTIRDVANIPERDTMRNYPRIGIIDGGVGPSLSQWVISKWDLLEENHTDEKHGTFIGGLLVAGSGLNGNVVCGEPDGAELIDIAIFPREDITTAFEDYFPGGLSDFLDEAEEAIAAASNQHGVRVFNFSLNVKEPVTPNRYSPHAARLDQIADTHNAVVIISAGNTEPQDTRPEWPDDPTRALTILASSRNDALLTPSESVRNVSVGALNPPEHPQSIPFAPARYSRRGPGSRIGVKPDFAHVGGSGSPQAPHGHGFYSITPEGTIVDGCGTSFAVPLVAKTAANLASMIEGEISRETLIALLVHHSEIPEPLQSAELSDVARYLVGHGTPIPTQEILVTDDHQITLVFSSRIPPHRQMTFQFQWPVSLVNANSSCRGEIKLTLVASPPLDSRFGAEFVRVNLDGHLQQERFVEVDGETVPRWRGQLKPAYLPSGAEREGIEAERIEHGLKWSPVKVYEKNIPRGVGRSSNWRLVVDYITRANEEMPQDGVPFTAILTIADIDGEQPVFNDVRATLIALGVQTADIRTAARVVTRV